MEPPLPYPHPTRQPHPTAAPSLRRSVSGVGKVSQRVLRALGICTCGDLLTQRGLLQVPACGRCAAWRVGRRWRGVHACPPDPHRR
jgi:hypothetical protein